MNTKRIISVSDLADMLLKMIEDHPTLANLWIRGEISNFKKHTAGHLYFSIKDEKSSVKCVMFKSRTRNLNFIPKDGMDCLVRGYVSLYPRDTMLQLYVEEIIPSGIGLQYVALEELKKKLQAKGYFAAERKEPLPFLPRAVGVVTSPTGAAIRDISKVIERRYPGMPIILYPALVQGEKAALTLAEGVRILGKHGDIDVIIIARGGGSAEDLGIFNSEIIADAVFQCPKPVISAIGHEIDFTITDLVADIRAATPSVAGEMCVPVKEELKRVLSKYGDRLSVLLGARLDREQMRLAFLANSAIMKRPERWVDLYQEELARQEVQLFKHFNEIFQMKKHQLEKSAGHLQALSPLSTLARGYSICKNTEGEIVSHSQQITVGDKLLIQLYKGSLECLVEDKEVLQ